ncbi:MAG: hypothetical protein IJO52_00135 [Clostridia bacterium]|nr:hypothetical protein [Clostridia bacterium]
MNVLYLILIILGIAGQGIVKKPYTEKTGESGAYLFSALTSLVAMLFFVVCGKDLQWDMGIIPYSLAFAVSYAACAFFGVLAVANGSLSLTSLMTSYSLMIPTFYGLFFLNDPVSIYLPIGIALLAISIFLINKKNDKCRITFKWLIYVLISSVGNGLCSTFQKMQQVAFDGAYKNEFMVLSLAIVTVVLGVAAIFTSKGKFKTHLYHARFTAVGCGAMNGAVNMLVMVLSGMMAASVMFPLISAGGIIVTYAVSKLLYKETLSKMQFWGLVTGTLSIVFLSI